MRSLLTIFCAIGFVLGGWPAALSPATASAAETSPGKSPASQINHNLLDLYLAEARVQDLLNTLKPESWKMTDADRTAFNHHVEAVRNQLQALEKWRYQFLYHPQDTQAAKNLLGTLPGLIPNIQKIRNAVIEYQNAAAAAPFEQTVRALATLADEVDAYMAKAFPGEFKRPATSLSAAAPHPSPAETSAAPQPKSASASPAATSKTIAPAIPAAHLEPAQLKALLLKVYLAAARVNDLLSLAQPGAWKMSDAERTAFNEQVQSLQSRLTELEKWRYQFFYHPGEEQLAEKTVAAINGVVSSLQNVATAESQFQNPAAGAQFEPPRKQLAEANDSLKSYVAYLQLEYQKELAAQPPGPPGSAGLQTVRIGAPTLSAPLTSITVATPPLTPAQVKSILYKIYVYVYRIHDLLTQEHPAAWKAPEAERTAESMARSTALARIADAEKWRSLFSEYPANMYDAFQAYRSIESFFQPLGAFSRGAGQFERAGMEATYGNPAAGIQSSLDQLVPYISFILQHKWDNVSLYQADLARCQNQLTYAMHSSLHPAAPMRNVLPVFQGRRVERRARAAKAKASTRSRKKRGDNKR